MRVQIIGIPLSCLEMHAAFDSLTIHFVWLLYTYADFPSCLIRYSLFLHYLLILVGVMLSGGEGSRGLGVVQYPTGFSLQPNSVY